MNDSNALRGKRTKVFLGQPNHLFCESIPLRFWSELQIEKAWYSYVQLLQILNRWRIVSLKCWIKYEPFIEMYTFVRQWLVVVWFFTACHGFLHSIRLSVKLKDIFLSLSLSVCDTTIEFSLGAICSKIYGTGLIIWNNFLQWHVVRSCICFSKFNLFPSFMEPWKGGGSTLTHKVPLLHFSSSSCSSWLLQLFYSLKEKH